MTRIDSREFVWYNKIIGKAHSQVRLIANGRVEFKDGSTYNVNRIDLYEFFAALKNIRDYYRRLTEIAIDEFELTKEGD